MKCKLCCRDLNKEGEYDELDHGIAEAHQNGICRNCWWRCYKTTYYDYAHNITPEPITKDTKKIAGSSNIITTIEYLLICLECKHQTPYGYLWFAICDGREHVLTSGHKLVKISEIIWQDDKALEILRIEINSAEHSSSIMTLLLLSWISF